MSIDVDLGRYKLEVAEDEMRDGVPQPVPRPRPDRELARAGRGAGERTVWRWVRRAAGAASAAGGGAALAHHFLFLAVITVTGVAVVLFVLVWLGLFLWAVLFGGDVKHERVFRVIRFFAVREEPSVTFLGLVPAQASRARDPFGAEGWTAGQGTRSARVRPGASPSPAAGSRSRATAAVVSVPGHPGHGLGTHPCRPGTGMRCRYRRGRQIRACAADGAAGRYEREPAPRWAVGR